MHEFNRRRLLGLGVGGLAAATLAGCASPGSVSVNKSPVIPAVPEGTKIRLTYWAWLKDLQVTADLWNAKNPNVQVDVVWIQGGNSGGYAKMYSSLAAGGGPDIGQVEVRQVPEFLLQNGLVDLSRYGLGDYEKKYDPGLWNQVKFNDGLFGVPQDSGPMAFYYQTELMDQVGGTPPKTWDDWATLSGEVRKLGPGTYLDVFPVGDSSVFTAYATQAGAQWFNFEGDEWIINMTDDATLMVADFFDKAIDKDLVNTAYGAYSPPWYAAAANGQIAGVTSASWGDALIESISGGEGKWKVAPMQTWKGVGTGSTYLGGSTAAVLANSKHPKEALDFCIWMTTAPEAIDSLIANSGIGWSPSPDYIGTSRTKPSAWFSGQNYNEDVFVPMAKEQSLDWIWSPLTQSTFNALSDGFRRKLTSGQTLVETMRQGQKQAVTAFRNKGLQVREA